MLCPRCQEPLATGQEYCLECGTRVGDGPRRGGSLLGAGWTLRALVAALIALAGGAAAIAATGGGGSSEKIVTAIGGFATAPLTTTGSPSTGALGCRRTGRRVRTAGRSRSRRFRRPAVGNRRLARARIARAKKLPQVGIIDSSRYASLHPGYWIVFSGVYASEAEATSALDDARRVSRTAAVRRVIP